MEQEVEVGAEPSTHLRGHVAVPAVGGDVGALIGGVVLGVDHSRAAGDDAITAARWASAAAALATGRSLQFLAEHL